MATHDELFKVRQQILRAEREGDKRLAEELRKKLTVIADGARVHSGMAVR